MLWFEITQEPCGGSWTEDVRPVRMTYLLSLKYCATMLGTLSQTNSGACVHFSRPSGHTQKSHHTRAGSLFTPFLTPVSCVFAQAIQPIFFIRPAVSIGGAADTEERRPNTGSDTIGRQIKGRLKTNGFHHYRLNLRWNMYYNIE